jgi:lactoylglutathione lyase
LVVRDVHAAVARAVDAGASHVVEPMVKPWGQTLAYVRDDTGFLVELCTAMGE